MATNIAFLPTTHPGQLPVAELLRQAAAGDRPRWEHLEVARLLDAVVVDADYLATRASPLARLVARRIGLVPAQLCEAFVRRRRFDTVCAWSDRLGLPLALLHKMTRRRGDLVMVSAWLSRPKKAVFFSRLGVHTHLRAIISGSRVQLDFAAEHLLVPRHKLHLAPWPVDTSFWRPQPAAGRARTIASVGWEARDYPTLLEAIDGLDVDLEMAVGVTLFASAPAGDAPGADGGDGVDLLSSVEPIMRRTFSTAENEELLTRLAPGRTPERVRVRQQIPPRELRSLYSEARFVVIPVHDVDSDCGITTLLESMAMGKAVIVTRTRGQVGVLEDGEQGLYVPPADPRALRAAIEHLLDHPEEAERMGRAGRRLVEQRYSLDAYARAVAAVIADDDVPAGDGVPGGGDGRRDATAAPPGRADTDPPAA